MKNFHNSQALRVGVSLVLAVSVTAGIRVIRSSVSTAPDFPCGSASQQEADISIASGEVGSAIGASLARAGVVKSSEAYFRLAVSDIRASRVAPGTHTLQKNLCAKEALTQLLDPQRIAGLINITEGMWISEVLPQMYRAGFAASEVNKALGSTRKPIGFSQIEGLLFPAQYSFASGTSPSEAISSMIARAAQEMTKVGFGQVKSEFSPQQLLIIASLMQAEGDAEDFAKISQVVRNRLKKGMPLQFDSTVHYVKKSRGSVFLSTQSTLISSPYNTYKRYGLPPGPINNPGAAAMRAALYPEQGDWLYFITVAPGDTRFTSTISEFNSWKVEYKKNLRAGKFRSAK